MINDRKRIEEVFARGTVVEAFPSKEELVTALVGGLRLKIYIGLDPTSTALHIGHAKNLMFLEELRQLGHEVIVLFGDFTALVGDPTGKASTRKVLTAEDIKKNEADWKRQIEPIITFTDSENPAKLMYNSEWLSKLSMSDVVSLSTNFTVQQMVERDMFEKRIKDGQPIHLNEFLYPLMQGYDSVAMDVNAELCGTDQIFNALAGRTLLKRLKNKDKFVIALNLLANPATGELMSKSNGTGVFIDQSPADLFGALMALPDPMIEPLYMNCTRLPLDGADGKDAVMALGPREAKARVAFDIVKRFHGEAAATAARETFEKTFAKGGVPDQIDEVKLGDGESVADALVKAGIVESKSEWRRLIDGGGIKLAEKSGADEKEEKISDANWKPEKGQNVVLKVGKRRFVKVTH